MLAAENGNTEPNADTSKNFQISVEPIYLPPKLKI